MLVQTSMSLEEFRFLIYVFRRPRNRSSPVQLVNSLLEVVGRGKKFNQLNLIDITLCAYTCDRGGGAGLSAYSGNPQSPIVSCRTVQGSLGLHVIENR
jgi:hypothetical protein